MGTTKIWKVKTNLARAIDYATDSRKTALKSDIGNVIGYASDEGKTLSGRYVTALNCNVTYAKEQFETIKKRFGKEDGILAFHAYQSFADYDDITPDMAHEIGVKLAEELWGDRFQVIVATHLNTKCLHNHFVINSVSFADGKKYHDCRSTYRHMREVSDSICRQYGLTVIEKPTGRGDPLHLSQKEKAGIPTRYSMAREAVDEAISLSLNLREFELHLKSLGYSVQLSQRRKYWTVTPKGWKKPIRLMRLGKEYTNERIIQRLSANPESVRFKSFQKRKPLKKQYLLLTRKDRIGKVGGLRGLYLKYCYMLGYLPKYTQDANKVPEILREDLLKCEKYTKQIRLLSEYGIHTDEELFSFLEQKEREKEDITERREILRKEYRRVLPESEKKKLKAQIAALTSALKDIRGEVRLAEDIKVNTESMAKKMEQIERENQKEVMSR